MNQARQIYNHVVASLQDLSKIDPDSEKFLALSSQIRKNSEHLVSLLPKTASVPSESMDELSSQVDKLHSAAVLPAQNYRRIAVITNGLRGLVKVSNLPQNAALRSKVASIVKKVAGVFAEVDTVQDLDKPLEQIEKAIHSLYGDQSKNSTYYFDRRNKGHHSKE